MRITNLILLGGLLLILTASFIAPMATQFISERVKEDLPWNCSTDQECTDEYLKRCQSQVECRSCWDVFIGLELFEYYEDKIDYLND